MAKRPLTNRGYATLEDVYAKLLNIEADLAKAAASPATSLAIINSARIEALKARSIIRDVHPKVKEKSLQRKLIERGMGV